MFAACDFSASHPASRSTGPAFDSITFCMNGAARNFFPSHPNNGADPFSSPICAPVPAAA